MSETFLGITSALRGMEAQQSAMDTTSHNIANANTPGYSRQIATMSVTDPLLQVGVAGELGTGVQVESISRAHDSFVQQQVVYQNGVNAQQQTLSDTLNQIGQVFNDPTDQGFSSTLSGFLTSWQQLANNPSDPATRAVVVSSGAALAGSFNQASSALLQMQKEQDAQIGTLTTQANTYITQIGSLNSQIAAVTAFNQQPNDLLDKRDALVGQLSQLLPITEVQQSNGMDSIALNGAGALVQGAATYTLATMPDPSDATKTVVTFSGSQTPLTITAGQIGGAIYARDTAIGSRITALDSLANSVSTAINGFQTAGYGSNGLAGVPFFNGSTAATIAVNPLLQQDPSYVVAASAPNQPNNNSVALQISQLQDNPPPGGTITLQAQYNSMISQLGVDGQQATNNVQTNTLVLQQLNAQQSSVSAVSLNEEAANLIQYQNAYQASARVISMMNQTITDMINQLG